MSTLKLESAATIRRLKAAVSVLPHLSTLESFQRKDSTWWQGNSITEMNTWLVLCNYNVLSIVLLCKSSYKIIISFSRHLDGCYIRVMTSLEQPQPFLWVCVVLWRRGMVWSPSCIRVFVEIGLRANPIVAEGWQNTSLYGAPINLSSLPVQSAWLKSQMAHNQQWHIDKMFSS